MAATSKRTPSPGPRPALIDYVPTPSAKRFHESTATVKAICGPVGSGKSLAWMMEFVAMASEMTFPLRGLVIRQSWPELRDATLVTWESKLEAISDWKRTDRVMQVFLGHPRTGAPICHTMDFRHARNAAEATRFMSTEYGYICLEEIVPAFDVGRLTIGGGCPQEIFTAALTRLRQPGVMNPELVCAFNPPPKRHWAYTEFVGPSETEAGRATLQRKGYEVFIQPAFENRGNLAPNYYERLLEILSPELADRFVHGKSITVYPGQPVYPQILEGVHIVEHVPFIPSLGFCTAHDFGRTPAVVFYQVTPEGQMRVFAEMQLWGVSTETMVERMRAFIKDELPPQAKWLRGFGDPAGQNPTETDDKTSFTIMAHHGYPLQAGAETLAARTEAVKVRASRSVGAAPALVISQTRAAFLADAVLGGYRYPKSGDGRIGFAPLKNDHSHIANAFEYGVSGEFSPFTGDRLQADEVHRRGEKLIPRYNPLDRERDPRGGGGWMSA